MRCKLNVLLILCALVCSAPYLVSAQDATEVRPETATAAEAPAPSSDDVTSSSDAAQSLLLLEAFASGYFEVVAISALELYTTAGVLYVDYAQGVASGDEALDALEHPALLHSSITTTLSTIYLQTTDDQVQLRVEIEDLAAVFDQLGELYTLLVDTFSEPTSDRAAEVEVARQRVDRAIDVYFGGAEPAQDQTR